MRKLTSVDVKIFHDNDKLWLILGSLISADSLIQEKDYEQSEKILNELIEAIPEANIGSSDRKRYLKYAKEGLELVQKEHSERFGEKKD